MEHSHQDFFEQAPVSLLVVDCSSVWGEMKSLPAEELADSRLLTTGIPPLQVVAGIRVVAMNAAARALFGVGGVGELCDHFARTGGFVSWTGIIPSLISETASPDVGASIIRSDGKLQPVTLRVATALGSGKKEKIVSLAFPAVPGADVESIVDITEQRQAEEALCESSKRYQDLADLLPQTIFETDLNGTLTYVNHAGFSIFGYDEDSLRRVNVVDTLVPSQREQGKENLGRVMRGDATAGAGNEYLLVKKDGTIFPALIYSAPLVSFGTVRGVRGIIVDITLLKRAEEQVMIRDRAIASSINAIAMIDVTGCLTFANTAFLTMWGYRNDSDVVGKSLASFFQMPGNLPFAIDALQEDRYWTGEMVGLKQGGERFHVHLATSIACDDGGRPLGLMLSGTDITARKQAEQDLKASERKFRAIVETTNEWIWASDPDAVQTYSNPAVYDILGYTPEEMIGRSIVPLLHPEDAILAKNAEERARLEKTGWSGLVLRWRHKDGSYRFLESTAIPLFADDGTLLGFQGADRDITGRRLVEEALEASEIRYRRLTENAPDIITRLALPSGCYEYVSPAAIDVTGYSPEEYYSTPLLIKKILHPDWHDYFQEEWGKVLEGTVPPFFEYQIISKSGETKWINQRVTLLRDDDGVPVAIEGIASDVTLSKITEEVLRQARQAADDANRAKSEFLANMSHEIRTPLTAIIGFAELLEGAEDSGLQKKYVEMIRSSAEILKGTVNDILDLAKIEAGKLELETVSFSPGEVVRQTTSVHAMIACQKGVAFSLDIDPAIPGTLFGDPDSLRKILANLVSNAVKFTPHGEIAVIVRAEPAASRTDGPQRLRLHLVVQDTGIGIPLEKQAGIFGSFTQADGSISRKYGGTGLGTTIARKLAELMGGTIWLESTPSVGSVFHVAIELDITPPALYGDNRRPRLSFNQIARLREKTVLHILIAEDNVFSRRLMAHSFAAYGHEAVLAANGREAVNLWSAGCFDLVLMDVQMPEMSGLAACEEIRRLELTRGGRVPIVAMTANVLKEDRDRCLAAGMDDYLPKPVTAAGILQKLCGGMAEPFEDGSPTSASEVVRHGVPLATLFRQDELPALFRRDHATLLEYARLFLHDLEEIIRQLRRFIDKGDVRELGRTAHSLKGLVVNLQDPKVSALACRIEAEATGNELAAALETVGYLQAEYDRLVAFVADCGA